MLIQDNQLKGGAILKLINHPSIIEVHNKIDLIFRQSRIKKTMKTYMITINLI